MGSEVPQRITDKEKQLSGIPIQGQIWYSRGFTFSFEKRKSLQPGTKVQIIEVTYHNPPKYYGRVICIFPDRPGIIDSYAIQDFFEQFTSQERPEFDLNSDEGRRLLDVTNDGVSDALVAKGQGNRVTSQLIAQMTLVEILNIIGRK